MAETSSMMVARRLHEHHHENYDDARAEIARMIGDISEHELFGRKVLLALYMRPETMTTVKNGRPVKVIIPVKTRREDIYQGTVCMVLAHGPDAFAGDEAYLLQRYGKKGPPKVGDWIFIEAQQGSSFSIEGEGAEAVYVLSDEQKTDANGNPLFDADGKPIYKPEVDPQNGRDQTMYEWGKGWPVRVVDDEAILGRVTKPHQVAG